MPAMTAMDAQAIVAAGAAPSNTISLSTLIDYIIQRTYHELSILSELLPRKTDMERKIEVVQFASRTRQLFVRLLALVKWANSASKVDKCSMISSFLDQQAMLFVETADILAKMARETLVNARLPSFSLPCAIDVLTKGTYTRLPACIKEKIVPPDPITHEEKKQTLHRLNQIIEHRVVTGNLPSHLRRPKIENGRIKFCVEHEFEVTLTLMGDGMNIPWRLLDIEILVEDPETGDGKALVHSLQISYIHQLVQSRLMDNDRPLYGLYNCLHSFCQSLQLEVLHSQTQRLIHHRLGEHVRIEEYLPGKSLMISYWRDPSHREGKPFQTIYKLCIHVDENDQNKPLMISHSPQIQGSESIKVAQAIKSDHLSVEKLLTHTIQVRSLSKLTDLEREFRVLVPGPCEIRDVPSILYIPILYPCMTTERLCVAVDIMKGLFMVSLSEKLHLSKAANNLTADVGQCINSDRRDLRKLLARMRLWLGLERCQKSIQHISVTCTEQLPFLNDDDHPIQKLSRNKLYLRMLRQSDYYVVVEAVEAKRRTVDFNYYLLHVTAISADDDAKKNQDGSDTVELPTIFMKPGHLVKLDTYAITHGPSSKVYDIVEEEANPLIRKRKLLMGDPYELPRKRPRGSPYFLPELLHIMAHCEERIPFVVLGEELQKRGLSHQGVEVDGDGSGMSLVLLDILPCGDVKKSCQESLTADLLSINFRIQQRAGGICIIEVMFSNCPVQATNYKENGPVHRVHFFHELSGSDVMLKLVESLIDDWTCLVLLYQAVLDFSHIYDSNSQFQSGIEIKSYNYTRLVLGYGPNKCFSVTIQYHIKNHQFQLLFGTCGPSAAANCHTLVSTHLTQTLNNDGSLAHLAQILLDTWSPMCSIGKLMSAPVLGLVVTNLNQPCTHFMVLPQSASHLHIVFRNVYCIDLHCQAGGVVAIRDGAYSKVDTSKVVETLTPISALKAFLNLYVDDTTITSAARRRSTTEDDHPPSPEMDPLDFISQQATVGSPAGPARTARGPQPDGLRFHGPMTPPSNPQTPASPSTQRLSQQYPSASPAGSNFPLASPPSLQHVVTPSPSTVMAPSPGNPTLHVPSPSSFVPAPSPQSLGITMPSPAAQFINPQVSQGAAVINPPSRLLPGRSWAASIPTLLSHDAFDKLCTQCSMPGSKADSESTGVMYCPLERFLCCGLLRRHALRLIAAGSDQLHSTASEPGVVAFKNETLQFKITLNMVTLQSVHLKVSPSPEFTTQWDSEELQMVEKFFDLKISTPPYKSHGLSAFVRLLSLPVRVLKDCIQIMRLELIPERNLKWTLQWCLMIPQGAPRQLAPVGTAAVVYKTPKFLFMVQLSHMGTGSEPANIIVPIVYDLGTNKTQAPTLSLQHLDTAQHQALIAINNSFKRFTEYNPKPNDCSLYPAVRELLSNLTVGM